MKKLRFPLFHSKICTVWCWRCNDTIEVSLVPDNLINGSFTALQGLTTEPLHLQFGQILEQLLLVWGTLTAHEQIQGTLQLNP